MTRPMIRTILSRRLDTDNSNENILPKFQDTYNAPRSLCVRSKHIT